MKGASQFVFACGAMVVFFACGGGSSAGPQTPRDGGEASTGEDGSATGDASAEAAPHADGAAADAPATDSTSDAKPADGSTPAGDAASDAGMPGVSFFCGGGDASDGQPLCNSATQYCLVLGIGDTFSFSCNPLPASCTSNPSCACALADPGALCPESDANNDGNMCSCQDDGGEITVTDQTTSA